MLTTSGAGFTILLVSLATAVLCMAMYSSSRTHPDDGEVWIICQQHRQTGATRYVSSGTSDRDMAQDLADILGSPHWRTTDIMMGFPQTAMW